MFANHLLTLECDKLKKKATVPCVRIVFTTHLWGLPRPYDISQLRPSGRCKTSTSHLRFSQSEESLWSTYSPRRAHSPVAQCRVAGWLGDPGTLTCWIEMLDHHNYGFQYQHDWNLEVLEWLRRTPESSRISTNQWLLKGEPTLWCGSPSILKPNGLVPKIETPNLILCSLWFGCLEYEAWLGLAQGIV